jgi:polar amino acid transport system substrate-binding protein
MRSLNTAFLITVALAAIGCGIPRDADDSLSRIQNGSMRVGVSSNPPWVAVSGDTIAGYEGTMLAELARQLQSRIETRVGAESVLLEALHDRKLDVVVGGLTADSRWKKDVALTRPYHKDKEGKEHVLALPPGENRWLVRVEEYLHDNEARLKGIPE